MALIIIRALATRKHVTTAFFEIPMVALRPQWQTGLARFTLWGLGKHTR
jgi:hypothetical protein